MAEVEEKVATVKRTKKQRVIKVAKEFRISVESLVEYLQTEGYDVKNPMSPVTEEMHEKISEKYGKETMKVPSETMVELDMQRKDQELRREQERLDSVRKKLLDLSKKKPPSLEEVQREAIRIAKKEKEAEKERKAEAVKEKQKKEKLKKKQEEAKRLEEVAKKKTEGEKKLEEKKTRRLEQLLAHSATEKKKEALAKKTDQVGPKPVAKIEKEKPEEKVEVTKGKPVEKVVAGEAPTNKVGSEAATKKTGEQKKKKKKKKERLAEEKKRAASREGVKGNRKKKKREKKRKVSEEDVTAAIKKTMLAMEDKGKTKRKRHQSVKEEFQEELEENVIKVSEFISVSELSQAMNVEANEVIKKCLTLGTLVSINQRLDMDTIIMVADEFGFEVKQEEMYGMDVIDDLEEEVDEPENLEERPPVVTIMGHVDHGKTSLLDHIRSSDIIAGEAGGITQHIGAYVVTFNEKKITFLDTPGHEAFTAMRARGAQVTDIVILVVASDDNVMPQTIEAINHARAANVPIIIAINKIDKPNANPELIKKQLSEIDILVEDWGGKYSSVELSAKTGENVDQLMELVVLQAELLELKANPNRYAKGVVIESELDKGRGPVATILVKEGSLNIGDVVVVGTIFGKVRAMFDERGKKVKIVPPAMPVQVLGFDDIPNTGDVLNSLKNERSAREISTKRQQLKRERDFRKKSYITLDEFSKRMRNKSFKELKLIVKADVAGSVEALSDSLIKLSNDEVKVNVIHKGVGAITETDVLLASASEGIIIGFQIRPNAKAWEVAETEKVDIRTYSIIYDVINDIKSALEGMLEPEEKEELLGVAEIREVFRIPKAGNIAGCYVQNGKIMRNGRIRVVREGKVVYEGMIDSLRRFKDDVKEVQSGYECGIGVENFNDIKVSDSLEVFKIVQIKRMIEA